MNLLINPKNRISDLTIGIILTILLLFVLIVSCEKENEMSNYNPPADHSVSKDGIMHKSGLNQPLDNCVSCHGTDLKGGNTGVSCFECHGKKW
ncbi:hypothetical protein [Maribellus sediminis]|uniref:hypothetical protein n=1 Tax=Maribellus sediminis TaxID=2696285 RepID=UPI00143081E8|nr:hypothetical protein [Maribellus sediminis]